MSTELTCEVCHKPFEVRAYRTDTARFCSRSCTNVGTFETREASRLAAIVGKKAHNNRSVPTICKTCGKEFPVSPSRVGTKKYCSQDCYTVAQRDK